MSIGYTIPFARTTGSIGYFYATTTNLEAAQNDVKSLLLTNWGERPMRREFGCNLKEFLFEQQTEETPLLVEDRIREQVAKWAPFVTLTRINVDFPADNRLRVFMSYNLVGRPESVDSFTVEVSR